MAHTSLDSARIRPPVRLSRRAASGNDSPIGYLMRQAVERADLISLAAGLVDQHSLPVVETREAVEHLLSDLERGQRALQYGTAMGHPALRQQLLQLWGEAEGVDPEQAGLGLDQVLVTNGSQQLLHLVSDALLDPGDIVLVSSPTYFVYVGVVHNLGARAHGVAMDEGGMCLDSLEAQLGKFERDGELERVKLIYVVSYYQNPTGISLAEERRPRLVEIAQRWSRRHRIFVLEDAAYRDLRYSGPDLHSVRYYDPEGETVILAQTFSKPFSPGFRIGHGFLPPSLCEAVAGQKGHHDFGTPNFNQHLIATLIERGLYQRHLGQLLGVYRRKLDAMLLAAEEYCGALVGVEWVRPQGGLYVWMTVPETIDTGRNGPLFERALDEGVMYVPGEYCYPGEPDEPKHNTLRLSFGVESEEKIREGMARLARALRIVLSA